MMDLPVRLQEPKFWLLSSVAAFAALHLTLVNRAGNSELLTTSVLFWAVAASLIWDQRQSLIFQGSLGASAIGAGLLGLTLSRSAELPDATTFLHLLPFVCFLGLALLASGFQGLRQYWKELLIFGLLACHPFLEMALQVINLSNLTAMTAAFLLKYMGFIVDREGTFLNMPTGRVEVYAACSGIQSTLQMLNISTLFLIMFPLRTPCQRVFCLSVGVLLGYFVNALRVALMAILVAFSNRYAFEYWHGGDGSLIFSALAVLVFGGFCWLTFLRHPTNQTPDLGG
ncbi:cyanoexosortase A [Pantanalinema sp. GBBB05]|uniref:cyanoexosortase A n=1 Tax=Pantanalinema sp. GBBB05 TaxID=2604139 RepID=UPI001E091880|nr:cyanoexosortase A [Pantanalinema sp. GBBB05]